MAVDVKDGVWTREPALNAGRLGEHNHTIVV